MQRYTIYLFLWNAQHVSDGSFAHHQELKTVYTAAGTLSKYFDKIPDDVYTVLSSWWWAKEPPETCRTFHRINKLCNFASCWLYLKTRLRCTNTWTSKSKTKYIIFQAWKPLSVYLSSIQAWREKVRTNSIRVYGKS